MLQTLKKQSKKKILLKAKFKKFIKYELLVYLFVVAIIFLCAIIFDKLIEAILFCVAHFYIRNAFDKQFHFQKELYCLMLTIAIILVFIPAVLPLRLSLLSSVPICFLISFFGFVAQDRIDLSKKVKLQNQEIDKLLIKINHKNIYAMNPQELYEHCRNCGLDDIECKIAYYVVIEKLKGKELYNAVGYSERQTIRKRRYILSKIK